MRFLRTNTAVIITVGPFLDATDGVTLETALTITNEKITLTADTDDGNAPTNILDNVTGATSGTSNDLNYITGNDAGMMQLELSAANTNRLGRMFLSITDAANHVPVFHEFMVLPAMIYDAFILGTDVLDTSVTQILGTAVSTPATAGILDVNLKNIANAAVSTSAAQLGVNAVNVGGTAQTGRDIGASVLLSSGTGTGQLDFTSGVVKANLAQILGTALTETAGLIAAGFKKFFNVATPTGTVNSLPDAVAGAAGGVFIAGTNAATTVTTALTTTFTGNLTGSVGSVTGAVGSVTGAVGSVTGAVGSVTGNVGGNVTGSVGSVVGAVGSVTGLTASDVGAIKTKTDYLPSVVAGGAGGVFIAGTNAATAITTALTANVTGDITGNLSGSVGSVTGAVGSVTGAVGSVTGAVGSVTGNVGGNVTGSVGSVVGAVGSVAAGGITAASIATDAIDADALAADALAEIKTQVVAALNTDTYAEPAQGAPAATTTLVGKIGYLYKAWRNKSTQTADTYTLYADNGTTTDQKATFSDDATTATRGKIGTGA